MDDHKDNRGNIGMVRSNSKQSRNGWNIVFKDISKYVYYNNESTITSCIRSRSRSHSYRRQILNSVAGQVQSTEMLGTFVNNKFI